MYKESELGHNKYRGNVRLEKELHTPSRNSIDSKREEDTRHEGRGSVRTYLQSTNTNTDAPRN